VLTVLTFLFNVYKRFLLVVSTTFFTSMLQTASAVVGGSTSGVTPVYFTLENPDTMATTRSQSQSHSQLMLSTLVSERLSDDIVTLTDEPYLSQVTASHARYLCTRVRVNIH